MYLKQLVIIFFLNLIFIFQCHAGSLEFLGKRDFGRVIIGSSKKLKIKIRNIGQRVIYLGNASFKDTDSYSIGDEGSCFFDGQSLRPNQTCYFYITSEPGEELLERALLRVGYYNSNGTKWYRDSIIVKAQGYYLE